MEQHFSNYRSNCPEVIYEKGVVRSFAKFTGKYLYLSLFFEKKKCFTVTRELTKSWAYLEVLVPYLDFEVIKLRSNMKQ